MPTPITPEPTTAQVDAAVCKVCERQPKFRDYPRLTYMCDCRCEFCKRVNGQLEIEAVGAEFIEFRENAVPNPPGSPGGEQIPRFDGNTISGKAKGVVMAIKMAAENAANIVPRASLTVEQFDILWMSRSEQDSQASWGRLNRITSERILDAMDWVDGKRKIAERCGYGYIAVGPGAPILHWFHLWLMYDGTKIVVMLLPNATVERDAARAEELYGRGSMTLIPNDTWLKPANARKWPDRLFWIGVYFFACALFGGSYAIVRYFMSVAQ